MNGLDRKSFWAGEKEERARNVAIIKRRINWNKLAYDSASNDQDDATNPAIYLGAMLELENMLDEVERDTK